MLKQTQKFSSRQSMSKNTFEVFHYFDINGKNVQIHHHDFYELYFFLSGDVTYLVEGQKYKLNSGDLLLINPMELHQPIPSENSSYERMVLWIDRNYLASLSQDGTDLASCFAHHKIVKTHYNNVFMRGRIAELFDLLNKESHSMKFGSETYAKSLLEQLLIEVGRMVQQKRSSHDFVESSSLVARVISYININYGEDVSLDSLSEKFFVNKYYLSHEFSQQMGVSVYKYLTLKRLSRAKELLLEGVKASQVATACGFHNYPTFFRMFKAEYGISPSKIYN